MSIEDDVIEVIKQMSRIKNFLSPIQCIELVNDLIKGTEHQHKLIEWKKKYGVQNGESDEMLGCVSDKWWHQFKNKRHIKLPAAKDKSLSQTMRNRQLGRTLL